MKKKSKRIIIALALALIFAATPLYAAGSGAVGSVDTVDTLTLEKARELALGNSKTLQKKLLSVDSSLLAEKAQNYTLLPQASLTLSGGLGNPIASGSTLTSSASISVTQKIYEGGKNTILAAIDRLATESARQEARAAYLDVLESADTAYYAVLQAQAAVEAAESDLSASQLSQSIAQAKFDAGIVIKSAVLEAQAETASKETALSQARKTLSVANVTLKSITGVSAKPQQVVFSNYAAVMAKVAAFDDAATDTFVASLYASGLAANPTLAVSSLAVSQAQKAIEQSKAGYLPTVAATWGHTAEYSVANGLDLAADSSLSIAVTIPLDFLTTRNTVQSKTLAAKQAVLENEATADSLNLEIQSAVYSLISAVRSVSSSQKALEYAESHYEVVLELYKLSKASSLELSNAELLVSSSRSTLISARFGFLSGLSTLKTLAGLESEALLLDMIQ